jgi:hypothetical protein
MIGTRLGPYEITAKLGAGGMGEVYRASDTKLKRQVAIKVLPAGTANDAEHLARFKREAQALASINHPNIAAIYDLEEAGDTLFLVLELVEGEDLAERLQRGAMPPDEAIAIAKQIAEALEAAHEKGIVHRDLKPANIKLTPDGAVKVLDFGLAKALASDAAGGSSFDSANSPTLTHAATMAGVIMGTAAYMAPEQARGKSVDRRADIWAFGVVLYEMLTGRQLFRGETVSDTLAAVLTCELDAATLPAVTPAAIRRLLRLCLERNPKNRLHDIADARIAIDDALRGAADTPSAAPPARAGADLRRWLVAAAAVAALVLGAAAGYVGRGRSVARTASLAELTFKPVTFEEGFVFAARFGPDGRTIVYSADWDGQPRGVFVTSLDSLEFRPLGFPGADLLSVSRSGELALLAGSTETGGNPYIRSGTLARASLTGGAPREELERVRFADLGSDNDVAVIREDERRQTMEYPVGQVLAELPVVKSRSWSGQTGLVGPRVSPSGNHVAFFDYRIGSPLRAKIFDRSGKLVTQSPPLADWWNLAWASADEVWVSAAETAGRQTFIFGLDLHGRQRVVFRAPGAFALHDISPQGEVLGSFDRISRRVELLDGNDPGSRNRTWREGGYPRGFSTTHTLLFDLSGDSGGPRGSVFIWRPGEQQPVRIADGSSLALSPDGSRALVVSNDTPPKVTIVPTGAGQPRAPDLGAFESAPWAGWLPDGRLVIELLRPKSGPAVYVLPATGGGPVPLLASGVTLAGGNLISPDGSRIAAIDADGRLTVCTIAAGVCQPVPGARDRDEVGGWSADGSSLLVYQRLPVPVQIDRIEVATGRRVAWRTVRPVHAAVSGLGDLFVSPDGAVVYDYDTTRSELYVIKGMK